jgi:hypothetical protein
MVLNILGEGVDLEEGKGGDWLSGMCGGRREKAECKTSARSAP